MKNISYCTLHIDKCGGDIQKTSKNIYFLKTSSIILIKTTPWTLKCSRNNQVLIYLSKIGDKLIPVNRKCNKTARIRAKP